MDAIPAAGQAQVADAGQQQLAGGAVAGQARVAGIPGRVGAGHVPDFQLAFGRVVRAPHPAIGQGGRALGHPHQ